VHATVDDFVGDYPMAATLQPDVRSRLDLIDWVSPTKAVYMSEAAKAIDFTTTAGCSRSAANRTVKPATDTAQLDDPSAQQLCRLHAELCRPRTGTPVVSTSLHAAVQTADAFMASFNVAKSAVNNTRAA
jgi:hypothetical protein